MSKKYKKIAIFLGIVLAVLISLLVFLLITKEEEKVKIEVDIVDEIKDYGYSVNSLDSEYYVSLFDELKEILNSEEIDKQEYAELVAKLFVTDLYSIDTKVNKYDIGGEVYYYKEKRSMYEKKVMDTFYRLLEDNTYGDRDQELPLVNSVEVVSSDTSTYMLGEVEVDCYVVELKWGFEKKLGYDDSGVVTLVENESVIEVVEYQPSE